MNKFKYLLILLCLFVTTNVYAETTSSVSTSPTTIASTSKRTSSIANTTTSIYDEDIELDDDSTESTDGEKNYLYEEYNGNKLFIDDQLGLLKNNQPKDLLEVMRPSTQYGSIGFVTIRFLSTDYEESARRYYYQKIGQHNNGTIFFIDMRNRKIYIFSDGKNYDYITTGKANSITDNWYTYASEKKYYECAKGVFEQIYTVLDGGKIAEPMRVICNVFLSITIGFILCFYYARSVSKIKPASNKEIISKIKRDVNIHDLTATHTGQRRVYSPQSSSSGGSSGGGGGGGSSGGGGGHSF